MVFRQSNFRIWQPQLDGLKGVVLILPSRALGGRKQTLRPQAPLRLIGTFFEENRANQL